MTIESFLPLIGSIAVLFVSIFVLRRNIKSKVNFTFALHGFGVCVWLFATFMMFQNKNNIEMAIFWDRVVYLGVIMIPAFMYHFYLAYTEKKNDYILFLGYFLSFIFLFLSRTDYFVKGVFVYKWGIHTKAQIMHHIFLVYFFVYVIIWFVKFYKYYKTILSPLKKAQCKFIIYDFLSLFSIGSAAYLPAYGFGVYPFAYIAGFLFVVILGYAIISTRLMDIKLALRQSTVFLGALLTTVIPIFVIKYLIQKYSPEIAYWSEIVVLMIAAALFPVLKEKFGRFANKYLFTSLYDSKAVIRDLTGGLSATLETKVIYQAVIEALGGALHSQSISFWQYAFEKNVYTVDYQQGLAVKDKFKIKGSRNIYGNYFKVGLPVSLEELKNGRYKELTFVKEFVNIGVEVIVPLILKDRLIGVICFGAKESRDIYNNEDFDLLRLVSSQVAISLENASLYEETKEFNIKLSREIAKATKDLRQANEELKTLDKAKSEFISIASHQLRTPLTVIKGYGSMILEGDFGAVPAPIKDNMTKIYESNERLIALVEDLLNISRIESGRLQFNFEACQLEESVASVMEELAIPAKAKGLQLIWQAPSEKLPPVKIDKTKIRQVLINIIDNAIKYTPKGSVTVAVKFTDGLIKFSSVDTGLGIDPGDLVNLFKKFSRGEHVSLMHTEGTGLGLYVGKMMIEAHQGKIWAESAGVDKGSQFYFTLPTADNMTAVSGAISQVNEAKA